jgi:hypothetical protein
MPWVKHHIMALSGYNKHWTETQIKQDTCSKTHAADGSVLEDEAGINDYDEDKDGIDTGLK